ncbi:hypothetical protein TNCV_4405041 [Trichonephila clavipes]|uniref:Uncharacterized protein n=1 Tax=Trichonephila clavipes TaxID=2585209 RepID=A0A8X6S1M9_TRICX|nr:hypothetical protein TNCV_4405041 [Trichonephila clavipes]
MEVLRHWQIGPGPRASTTIKTSSGTRFSLDKIMIQFISMPTVFYRLYSPKTGNFGQHVYWLDVMTVALAYPPPYTINTHSVKRWLSVEPVCAIVRVIGGAYICARAQGLLLCRSPGSQEVLRRPCEDVMFCQMCCMFIERRLTVGDEG